MIILAHVVVDQSLQGGCTKSQVLLSRNTASDSNSIDPSRQSDTCTSNLHFNERHRSLIILPTKIILLHPLHARREHVRTNKHIRLRRPRDSTLVRVREVRALAIVHAQLPGFDPLGKFLGPDGSSGFLFGGMSVEAEAVQFTWDGRVPDAVQVEALRVVSVEGDGNVVAAAAEVFGVQGLVDVADEVQKVFESFVAGVLVGIWAKE